jgi:uracil-DNA glycosylase
MKKEVVIEKEWDKALRPYMETDAFASLVYFVAEEYKTKEVFPAKGDIFKVFELTPFSKVRVVILGQDPYHDKGQACGLSFSVPDGVRIPPSLKNIYKEIQDDTGSTKDMTNGNLIPWAEQGVLLLNTILTVVAHTPASHKGKGWEEFTDTVLQTISDSHEHVVFILWGNYAERKSGLIDRKKHCVLTASHPSPLSSYRGFFGCKHFSLCNRYLEKHGHDGIVW